MLLAGLTVAVPAAGAAELPPGGTFQDDNGSVHEAAIEAIAAVGVTKGCNPPENTMFCPDQPVTRGEMATFLHRALNLGEASVEPFSDLSGSVHTSAINAIAAAGITKGCNPPNNNEFCPDRAVTRAEMASMLVRAFGIPWSADLFFSDLGSSVHAADINSLAAAEITLGCNPPENDRFCPHENVTRGQMATFLMRALDLEPIEPPSGPVPPDLQLHNTPQLL